VVINLPQICTLCSNFVVWSMEISSWSLELGGWLSITSLSASVWDSLEMLLVLFCCVLVVKVKASKFRNRTDVFFSVKWGDWTVHSPGAFPSWESPTLISFLMLYLSLLCDFSCLVCKSVLCNVLCCNAKGSAWLLDINHSKEKCSKMAHSFHVRPRWRSLAASGRAG
jgi:hypothetical protein